MSAFSSKLDLPMKVVDILAAVCLSARYSMTGTLHSPCSCLQLPFFCNIYLTIFFLIGFFFCATDISLRACAVW